VTRTLRLIGVVAAGLLVALVILVVAATLVGRSIFSGSDTPPPTVVTVTSP
jgi:hypothetical protein